MKKLCLFLGVFLSLCSTSVACEEPQLPVGYVLCETLSMYEDTNFNSNILIKIPYGETVSLVDGFYDGWTKIISQYITGYVRSDYLLEEPSFYETKGETAVYAMPAKNSKRVALLPGNTSCAIIDEYEDYYVVSLRGAAGFIPKE